MFTMSVCLTSLKSACVFKKKFKGPLLPDRNVIQDEETGQGSYDRRSWAQFYRISPLTHFDVREFVLRIDH